MVIKWSVVLKFMSISRRNISKEINSFGFSSIASKILFNLQIHQNNTFDAYELKIFVSCGVIIPNPSFFVCTEVQTSWIMHNFASLKYGITVVKYRPEIQIFLEYDKTNLCDFRWSIRRQKRGIMPYNTFFKNILMPTIIIRIYI